MVYLQTTGAWGMDFVNANGVSHSCSVVEGIYIFVHFKALTNLLAVAVKGVIINKGNNKITEFRTILQRESPNS
jgi:hypothetical protein